MLLKKLDAWCYECYQEKSLNGQHKPKLLERAIECAKRKNGTCLSTECVNISSILEWKCEISEHRSWHARLGNLLSQDQWCPECSKKKYKTENRVRMFLETAFGFSLPSYRPDWIRNPKTGRKLELDGYNEDHGFAFEHDGQHHHKTTLYSKSVPNDLIKRQKANDRRKRRCCKERGVKLVTIPILLKGRYDFFLLLRHVINKCQKQGIKLTYTLSQIREMKKKFVLM